MISSVLLGFEFSFTVRTVLVLLENLVWLESHEMLASGIWTGVVVNEPVIDLFFLGRTLVGYGLV